MQFETVVLLGGKTATGLVVPPEVLAALGGGRPKVVVTVGGHTYRSTIATLQGEHLIPLSAENREAAGVAAGDTVQIDIEADAAPREVNVPEDLAAALAGSPAREFFDGLSFTHRKEWVRWITDAKKPETRQTRLDKTVEALVAGKKTR